MPAKSDLLRVTDRPRTLALALLLIAGAIVVVEAPWAPKSTVPPAPADLPPHLAQFPAAPDFGGATGWVGSEEPLDLVDLRGQVVLVDFWTYSCVNCIRTFPYVQDWWERYRDDGLQVVGVHTPEFRFEHDAANVQAARERYGLTFPTAQDNGYAVWDAYHNRFWPAKYLIDPWGRIRYTHFGEGAYAETESHIRALLEEAGNPPSQPPAGEAPSGPRHSGRTPELFASDLGGAKRVGIGSDEGYHPGQDVDHARPTREAMAEDRIYLVGKWHHGRENVTAIGDGGHAVLLDFQAGASNFVASTLPGSAAEGACVAVHLDGAPIMHELAGRDVAFPDPEGGGASASSEAASQPCIPLDDPRSYDYYAGPFGRHLLEVEVPEGFTLFSFAFSNEPTPGST